MKKRSFEVTQPQNRVSTGGVTAAFRGFCGILCAATAITACTTTEEPTGGVYVPTGGTGGVTATGGNPNAGTATGGNPNGATAGTANTGGTGGAATAGTAGAGATAAGGTGGTAGDTAGGSGGAGVGGGGTAGMPVGGNGGSGGSGGGITVPPGEVTFEENVRVDDSNSGQQTEVTMDAGPDGLVMAGWMDFRNDRTCAFSVSTDGGATWSENMHIRLDTGSFVGDPAVAVGGDGTLYAGCQEYGVDKIRMTTSTDAGDTWSEVQTIQDDVVDKPWLGASPTEPGLAFVSWLGGNAGIKRTTDGGETWGPIHRLGGLNHGTTISVASTGLVHVGWIPYGSGDPVRYARSDDNGESWDDTRTVAETGTFCWSDCSGPRQHPILGGDADPTGQYVAFTWAAEQQGGQGDEDIWLIYSSDGGDTFTDPLLVNDNDNPSRQLQPWVAVDAHGRVHVAWTDLRNDQNEVWYARSADPAEGFEPNIQVTDDSGRASGGFMGDYKGITISGTDVLVIWQDTRNDSGDMYAARALNAAGP